MPRCGGGTTNSTRITMSELKSIAMLFLLAASVCHATPVQEDSSATAHDLSHAGLQATVHQWASQAASSGASDYLRHHQPSSVQMAANNQVPLTVGKVSHLRPSSTNSWPEAINLNPHGNNLIEHSYNQQKMFKSDVQASSAQSAGENSLAALGHQGSLLSSDLELALRQASGDESVFQPSPAIGAAGHNSYDWNAPLESISGQHRRSGNLAISKTSESNMIASNQPPSATTTTPSSPSSSPSSSSPTTTTTVITTTTTTSTVRPSATTELNNHVAIAQPSEPVILNHQESIASHQKEYFSNANTSLEFNNQVIYEGPATPPSAVSSDDYYFSSSERVPSSSGSSDKEIANDHNEQLHSNSWWAIGLADELERVSNLTRDDYLDYCDRSPLLINNKQRSLCRLHPRVMSVVARGLRMAMDECQAKFASNRWNCSSIVHSLSPTLPGDEQPPPPVFGDVMRRPNRERSFLNAIIAAGLAHSMTKACSQGELPEECSCDRKIRSKNNRGRIEWVACSDDIDYGARFSREFTDNFDPRESDATSTIYMHNSEVGRRVFKSATDITCTCLNGESGSCQTKRCWKHLGSYSDVMDELIKRYEGATHVQRSNRDPHKLRPVRRGVRKPKRKDLVYIEESPDYCQQDTRFGVLGTQNRLCNSTSQGPDSCSLLCCGRGFQSVVDQIEEDCNCKFVWCCQVKCDKCKRFVTNDICN